MPDTIPTAGSPEWITQKRAMCDAATPGPHQARFIFRMIRAVRNHATTLGLMLQDDDTRDWADAELWANAQYDLELALSAIEERDKRIAELEARDGASVAAAKRIAELERQLAESARELISYDVSYGGGGGESAAFCIADLLGYDDARSVEQVGHWLQEFAARKEPTK